MSSDGDSTQQPREEYAQLHYIEWSDIYFRQKPYELMVHLPTPLVAAEPPFSSTSSAEQLLVPHTNISFSAEHAPQKIRDLRGREDQFTLSEHGFQVVRGWDIKIEETGRRWVEGVYLRHVERLLRSVVKDVVKVVVFDWRVRSADPKKSGKQLRGAIDMNDSTQYQPPAVDAHVDHSAAGAEERARYFLGDEEAQKLLKKHFQIINVWRPIANLIEDWPLTVCDGSTVDIQEDLLVSDVVQKSYVGETYYALHRDHYRWYYLNRQTENETLLLKIWDNDPTAAAKCCPHASFRHRCVPENVRPRESIEVRALIFSDT